MDLKLVKRALKRAPLPLNLVTRADQDGPLRVPALGSLWGPVCQL